MNAARKRKHADINTWGTARERAKGGREGVHRYRLAKGREGKRKEKGT